MAEIAEQVGQQIKQARKAKGLSQSELAKMLGVTKGAVSAYETGKQNLTLGTLQKISTALEAPLTVSLG